MRFTPCSIKGTIRTNTPMRIHVCRAFNRLNMKMITCGILFVNARLGNFLKVKAEVQTLNPNLRILDRYASLRRFAIEADIPYNTLMTLLSRGIGGASFDVVMRMCRKLEIDPLDFCSEE